MIALTARLPGNSSRTSTQAISVPAAALIAATTSETRRVNRSADTACRLDTDDQKASRPPSVERTTTAASGSTTITLSQTVTTPSASAPDPREERRAGRALARAVTAAVLT